MASQPVKRQMVLDLASLASPDQLDLPADTPPDTLALAYLCAYLEQGGRISKLCQSLGVSRFLLMRWVKGDKERESAFTHARTLGSDALVDEGGDLLDAATRDTIAVANARAGWRKWLASKYDPATYGEGEKGTLSIGSLHLHAALSRPLSPITLPPVKVLDTPPVLGPMPGAVERGYPTGSESHPTESKALPAGEIVGEPPLLDSRDKG